MHKKDPYFKRVKRHVSGRMNTFFAATAPGLESLCHNELMSLPIHLKNLMVVNGGVEFEGRVHDCYTANLYLKTANRILMRITQFKASNFRQLEQKTLAFPWELYLYPHSTIELKISTKHSRLYHKEAISEHIHESLKKRLTQFGNQLFPTCEGKVNSATQRFFVRAVDDVFTISMDSSGDLLYKRGIKSHASRAPIRETIAAAILATAGYSCKAPLIDPMCGTGTFSIEAAMMAHNIPAGWYRNFAFMGWPCFRQSRWEYLKREAEKQFLRKKDACIFASDKEQLVCDLLSNRVKTYNWSAIIRVSQNDFFTLLPKKATGKKGLITINPPYGIRIGTRKEGIELFREIIQKLHRDFLGWKVAMVIPESFTVKHVPFRIESKKIFHGGLWIRLITGKIE